MNPVRFMLALVVSILLGLAAFAFARYAAAHGSAQWIMDSPVTRWCCSPVDCAPAAVGEIIGVEGIWLHVPSGSFLPLDSLAVYDSIDNQVWRCLYGGHLRCLFLPP